MIELGDPVFKSCGKKKCACWRCYAEYAFRMSKEQESARWRPVLERLVEAIKIRPCSHAGFCMPRKRPMIGDYGNKWICKRCLIDEALTEARKLLGE